LALTLTDFNKTFKRVGYLRFGKYADRWFISKDIPSPWTVKLRKEMKQAGWEMSLRGYLGMMLFGMLLTFVSTIVLGILISILISISSNQPLLAFTGVVASFILAALLVGFVYWLFTYVPGSYIRGRRVELDNSLPTVSSYMSAMTSSGVPPAPIFASLAKEEINRVVTEEATRINRDIEILGLDILKALEQAAFRSPSERWAGFLEGMIATVTSGGDLTSYLATETKSYMKLKQEETKEFIEELGVMAEIFMVLGVVAPLFFVIMVAIVSILSSGNSSGTNVLLYGIIYIIVPFLMLFVMILLDTMNASVDS